MQQGTVAGALIHTSQAAAPKEPKDSCKHIPWPPFSCCVYATPISHCSISLKSPARAAGYLDRAAVREILPLTYLFLAANCLRQSATCSQLLLMIIFPSVQHGCIITGGMMRHRGKAGASNYAHDTPLERCMLSIMQRAE